MKQGVYLRFEFAQAREVIPFRLITRLQRPFKPSKVSLKEIRDAVPKHLLQRACSSLPHPGFIMEWYHSSTFTGTILRCARFYICFLSLQSRFFYPLLGKHRLLRAGNTFSSKEYSKWWLVDELLVSSGFGVCGFLCSWSVNIPWYIPCLLMHLCYRSWRGPWFVIQTKVAKRPCWSLGPYSMSFRLQSNRRKQLMKS